MLLYHGMSKQFIIKRKISRDAILKVFKAIYRPVLTYSYVWIVGANGETAE